MTQPDLPKQEKEYEPRHTLYGVALADIGFGVRGKISKGSRVKVFSVNSKTNIARVELPFGVIATCQADEIELEKQMPPT